jgi:hypothetical protein
LQQRRVHECKCKRPLCMSGRSRFSWCNRKSPASSIPSTCIPLRASDPSCVPALICINLSRESRHTGGTEAPIAQLRLIGLRRASSTRYFPSLFPPGRDLSTARSLLIRPHCVCNMSERHKRGADAQQYAVASCKICNHPQNNFVLNSGWATLTIFVRESY